MADHPSFSLGFGLSDDDEQVPPDRADTPRFDNVRQQESYPTFDLVFDEDEVDFRQAVAPDSDLDCGDEEPRPLKRLRRGCASTSSAVPSAAVTPPPIAMTARVSAQMEESGVTGGGVGGSGSFCSPIDEIEEFSSQEEPNIHDGYMRSAIKDAYSSSKVSLRNRGVLMSRSTTKTKTKKITPNSISSTLSNLEKGDKTKLLPKLTLSPLRKIHILDTDSDSDNYPNSDSDHKKNEAKLGKGQREEKSTCTYTPALDEFCKEYFRSRNDLNAPLNKDEPGTSACSSRVFDPVAFTRDFEDMMMPQVGTFGECSNNNYPCSKYFNHNDARVKALVREILPHFIPIGMADGRDYGLSGRETLDYMCQGDPKRSAKKSRKSKNTQPNDSTHTPTDVGKRRVQAYGQKGHWLTQEGKKIYVSKDGKEMTGRLAYRQYKRESGAKFRRAKKSGTGNRKRGKK